MRGGLSNDPRHACHVLFVAAELRLFLSDKLSFPATDAGEGWLILDPPEADLGVHPTEDSEPRSGTADISFYCDNIAETDVRIASPGASNLPRM